MKDDSLSIPLLISLAVHVAIVLFGAALPQKNPSRSAAFVPIEVVDIPRPQSVAPPTVFEAPPEIKRNPPKPRAPAPPKKIRSAEKPELKRPSKSVIAEAKPPQLPVPAAPLLEPLKEEPAKLPEAEPAAPAPTLAPPGLSPGTQSEGGGSEAGAGNLFGKGDVGVVPGSGTTGGGSGTAAAGLGRGAGPPGLPAPTTPLRTNREATPVQTVRASYPPMALRMGLESDVSLKIEVDAEGKVTKAEIVKSGGPGFDDEALKAVKQARFEPAQKDGKEVTAEFTYVYRFRLRK